MLDISIFSAFLAGLLTFLAPCTLPLVPGYLAYLGGIAATNKASARTRVLVNAFFFVTGFTLVFVLLGMLSGGLGKIFMEYRDEISRIGGVVVVFFGLSMVGLFDLPSFRLTTLRLPKWLTPGSKRAALLMGLFFALGWSPCLGPILGTILVRASAGGSVLQGGFLLLVFALGLALPFFLLALVFERAILHVARLEKWLPVFAKVGGLFFVVIGVLLIIGKFGVLTVSMSHLFDITSYDWFAEHM